MDALIFAAVAGGFVASWISHATTIDPPAPAPCHCRCECAGSSIGGLLIFIAILGLGFVTSLAWGLPQLCRAEAPESPLGKGKKGLFGSSGKSLAYNPALQ